MAVCVCMKLVEKFYEPNFVDTVVFGITRWSYSLCGALKHYISKCYAGDQLLKYQHHFTI